MTDPPGRHSDRSPLAASVADDALEEINRLWTIARVLASTAHDVNNALQVISGSIELLEGVEFDPVVRRRVEAIRTEAAKAAAAVNRLLTYTRARPVPPRPVNLHGIAQTVLDMRRASAGRSRIVLMLEDAGFPPCLALVDETRAVRALVNLVLSAEERARGQRNARIVIGVGSDGDEAVMTVTASSEGPSSAEAPSIVEPSPAARALTTEAQLWAASHMASALRGGVSVEHSELGMTLTLRLPRAPHDPTGTSGFR